MQRGGSGGASTFDRFASGLALALVAGLSLAGPPGSPGLPSLEDFGQYYMAGAIALEGRWENLYPLPRPGAALNAGWRDGSEMKPGYAGLAASLGVGDVNRFVLPPPIALLFAPLALLPYEAASWTWFAVLVLCGWGVALQAGRLHAMAHGEPSRLSGIVVLLVAISPLLRRSIRTAQISPLVALCIGGAILALLRRRDGGAGALVALGGLAKILPASLIALPALLRRRTALAAFAGIAAGSLALSVAVMGRDVHREYVTEIAPTLRESSAWRGNQSVAGTILRVTDARRLAPEASLALAGAGAFLYGGACVVIHRRRAAIADSPPLAMAAAVLLLLPPLIFAPIAWEHYYVYLCPLWGWLAWEAGTSRGAAAAAWGAVALTWAPLAIAGWAGLREPLLSHMLAGAILMLILAARRLVLGAAANTSAHVKV